MLKLTEDTLNNPQNHFIDVTGNQVNISSDLLLPIGEKGYNIEEDIKKYQEHEKGKLVLGCRAAMEYLPFQNEQFDCYISNYALQLSSDKVKTVKETFRVLKTGSIAAFAIWGSKEKSNFHTIFPEVFKSMEFTQNLIFP